MVQDKTAGRLSGKVAFLAGATGGIGRTIAEQFGRQGAQVVVGGRRRSRRTAVRPSTYTSTSRARAR
jgi:NAD(P)-dependent dehydrogenase (short-subunit alcohol dehydrogenase family)